MHVEDFDFELPADRIAQRPVEPRDASRLLRVATAGLADRMTSELPLLLEPDDLIVFNDTKVIPARLAGRRGAARVSVTLHLQAEPDLWWVFAKPGKRLAIGHRVEFAPGFAAVVEAKRPEGDVALRFDRGGADLIEALQRYGTMPLPPYIRGGIADERDRRDYQTLFARAEGAVAAPTAALHFTPGLITALEARGIGLVALTLHVGAGTFLPVRVGDTDDHVMHAEYGVISAEAAARINRCRAEGGRIVAIGTTSLRLLESAAVADGTVAAFAGTTDLFITPGYRFKVVDRLMTNFHLPRSTLFMLVAGFAGLERMKAAYAHAVAAGYRFYSYGDACLIDRIPS